MNNSLICDDLEIGMHFCSHIGNQHITFNYCELWCLNTSSILGSMKNQSAFTIFQFWYQKMIFSLSNFLMVHVLDQEVGPKGPQEHKLK